MKNYIKSGLAIAITVIAGFEGVRYAAYIDPVGIPTICYGSTKGVKLGDTKTHQECLDLLSDEAQHFYRGVDRLVTVDMTPEVHAAFTSFAYNVGLSNFKESMALRKLNSGDTKGACDALIYVYIDKRGVCRGYGCGWSKGKRLRGLVNRREAERELCLDGLY